MGDGTLVDRTRPVVLLAPRGGRPLIGVTDIDGGAYDGCLTVGGAVRCWGFNQFGEVGDGTTTQRTRPVLVQFP